MSDLRGELRRLIEEWREIGGPHLVFAAGTLERVLDGAAGPADQQLERARATARTLPHADVHVLPVKDLRPHEETRTCWCHPCVEEVDANRPGFVGIVVIHHSLDGRELVETHGVH